MRPLCAYTLICCAPACLSAVGPSNVFVSIIESYSEDATPHLLQHDLVPRLSNLSVPHRIWAGFGTSSAASSDPAVPAPTHGTYRYWPYGTAPERIRYLSEIRNAALGPLSSGDPSIRLPDFASFTKVIFLNDVYFEYTDILKLLGTRLDGDLSKPSDADVVCATDFGRSGTSSSVAVISFRR